MPTRGESYIKGLLDSTIWSVPELFGFEPPKEVQMFRQDNPVMGFGTSLLGSSVPYLGWYKGTRLIKGFDDLIGGIGKSGKAPVINAGIREAARFAPLELARIGTSQAFGDEGLGDMIGSAALNTALAGAAGSLGGFVQAAGKRVKSVGETIPDLDTFDPPQLQLRALEGKKSELSPMELAPVQAQQTKLRELIRREDAPDSLYVHLLDQGHDRDKLNWLFNASEGTGTKRSIVKRKFVQDDLHFRSEFEWQNTLGKAGINPVEFERWAQYPRFITSGTPRASTTVRKSVTENMSDIGDGWYMTREADDGMFVMAKEQQDNWVVFKTDSPDVFRKEAAQFGSLVVKENAWLQREFENIKDAGPIVNKLDEFQRAVSLQNYTLLTQSRGKQASLFHNIAAMSGMKGKLGLADSEAIGRVRDAFRHYFTPTLYQTKGSPRATYILGSARAVRDAADDMAQRLMYGKFAVEKGKSLLGATAKAGASVKSGGIHAKIEALDEIELQQVAQIFRDAPSPAVLPGLYASGKLTEKSLDLVQDLYKIASSMGDDIIKAEKAVGLSRFRKRANHMLIPREWEGELMIAVRDGANRLRGIASGHNNRQAEANLKKMLERNPSWQAAERKNRSDANLPRDMAQVAHANTPGFYNTRHDIKGYKWDFEDWSKNDLTKAVENAIRSRTQRQANIAIDYKLKGEVDRLAMDDPQMFAIVQERLGDFKLEQRLLAQVQNKLADKLLAPILGANSASRIASTTNSLMWHFELGGFRLGYIIMNALTPLQTVLPEIHYAMNAAPAQLGNYYTHFAAMGTRGPVGTLGVLDGLKFMKSAMQDMRKPSDELTQAFEWAVNERVITPRVVEEFVGESSARITDLKRAIGSGEGFVDWLRATSEFLPTNSERFSRAYSYVTGFKMAKELLGVIDPQDAHRFAKQFVSRTMYQYAQADRAAIMTTPAGGVFGLFKNWMLHYMHTMLEYTGEGVARGNWSPLLWQQTATWGVGGLAASPLYGIASAFNDIASDKDLIVNAYDMMGQESADGLFYGLPTVLANVSLTSQASSPLANPMRDAEMLFSIVHMDRISQGAKTFGAAMDHWQATGEHPGKSEDVRQGLVRAFAPKTLYRLVQSVQDSGIESLTTGYPILKDASVYDRILYASGLNPTEIERTYAVADLLYRDKERRRAMVQAAGKAYKEAMENRDSREMWMILRGSMKQGLDASSVLSSAARRYEAGNQEMLQRVFNPENIGKYRSVLGY